MPIGSSDAGRGKLSARLFKLLRATAFDNIMDDGASYYRLGGRGCVDIRYDCRSLPRLRDQGLVEYRDGYYRATEAGHVALGLTSSAGRAALSAVEGE